MNIKNKSKLILLLILMLLISSCQDKYEDYCSNQDAVNYHPKGKDGECIYPSDKIIGSYWFTIVEYPLQSSQEGETHLFEIRDSYCYGPEDSYKYVQFFSLQSPFDPSDFCLLLDEYNFEFTEEMRIRWTGAKLTGHGSFDVKGNFDFSGTIHRTNGTEYPIVLKGL